jgi:hypothetical protein
VIVEGVELTPHEVLVKDSTPLSSTDWKRQLWIRLGELHQSLPLVTQNCLEERVGGGEEALVIRSEESGKREPVRTDKEED